MTSKPDLANPTSSKTKRGRPPALDEVKRREICAILAMGGSRRLASQYVGCAPTTIPNTAARDPEFQAQLCQAESRHELGYLQSIQAASRKEQYWRAAAWALEHHYPQRYAVRNPGVVTLEQITQMLAQFAEIIVQEVPDPDEQKRIINRLESLGAAADQADD